MSTPRDPAGRFLPALCPDPNCDGKLVYEEHHIAGTVYPALICDGLTHDSDDGELVACARSYDAARKAP